MQNSRLFNLATSVLALLAKVSKNKA